MEYSLLLLVTAAQKTHYGDHIVREEQGAQLALVLLMQNFTISIFGNTTCEPLYSPCHTLKCPRAYVLVFY